MSKLNKDILFLIFEELQDDSKSLFSCLMVNRLWCETVIPILWKNPWRYNINYNDKNHLFAIIVFYLSNDIKEFLINQRIQLPTISFKSLLFDYLSFCKSININIINFIISNGSPLTYNKFLLQQEFYKLFMKKCSELKYLDMKSIEHQIFYFPKANTYFESLIELECDTSIDPSYFYGLARYCQYIQRITIINIKSKSNYGIAKLIEIQKNLKYFEWIDRFDDDYFNHYTECPYTEIFLELEKKADTLNHFKLFFWDDDSSIHTFPRKLLPKLYKLKTLVINEFSFVNEDLLKVLFYKDLEILNINYITLEEASKIIENSGGHLKQILLKPVDYYDDYFDDNSINFIRKVYKYCPSIEYLSLAFPPFNDHFIEFERLLNICKNLKSLLLVIKNSKSSYIYKTGEKIFKNGEELLKVLIKTAPINLREIRFFNDFKFSLESLEEFLEKWRGRPAISILTTDYIYESENYKILIDKYKNDGVIKDFRVETIMNVENMDFKI